MNASIIPIVSLGIAALAVIVGPFVQLVIARRQMETSRELSNRQMNASRDLANRQMIAPMRQAWINNLRDLISELMGSTLHYFVSGFEDRKDAEYQRLQVLEFKIELMLNPREADHERLIALIRDMMSALESAGSSANDFDETHTAILGRSKEILKREWERVKEK